MFEDTIVTTSYGRLSGGIASSRLGRKYNFFSGIPYAEPPVGPLRFKQPVRHKGWEGVQSALIEGNPSIHLDSFTGNLIGDEDCLYLNIYTPQCSKPLKPVIVYIHGGGYCLWSGSSKLHGADFMLDRDVVLVTFNYRLGALGFLNLDLEDAAGNMGLKDQTLLLQWVKEEIENFGGDPNNVTISGNSAGGASVTQHMVSPLSRGLFHKAIAQSGTLLCEWAFMKHHIDVSKKLGQYLGADPSISGQELLDYLRTVPAEKFAQFQNSIVPLQSHVKGYHWAFAPSIETVGSSRFLASDPYQLIIDGGMTDVPFMTGFNTHEGLFLLHRFTDDPFIIETLNSNFGVLFKDLAFPSKLATEEISLLTSRTRTKYFGEETIEWPKHFDNIVKFYGDIMFNVPTIMMLHHLHRTQRQSPIYFYRFLVDTTISWFKQFMITNKVVQSNKKGTSHCGELPYLFNNSIPGADQNVEPNSLAEKTIVRMTTMWTNFAKSGNPSDEVNWEPLFNSTSAEPMGLNIGEDLVNEPIKEFDTLTTFRELFCNTD